MSGHRAARKQSSAARRNAARARTRGAEHARKRALAFTGKTRASNLLVANVDTHSVANNRRGKGGDSGRGGLGETGRAATHTAVLACRSARRLISFNVGHTPANNFSTIHTTHSTIHRPPTNHPRTTHTRRYVPRRAHAVFTPWLDDPRRVHSVLRHLVPKVPLKYRSQALAHARWLGIMHLDFYGRNGKSS